MAHTSRKATGAQGKRGKGRIQPYAWLGAGAVTLGLGAAMASGTAIAYADDGSNAGAGGVAHSRSADHGSSSPAKATGATKRSAPSAAAATPKRTASSSRGTQTSTSDPVDSVSDNGPDTPAPAAAAVSADETVVSNVADTVVKTVKADLTPKPVARTRRATGGSSSTVAPVETQSAAPDASAVASSASAPPVNQGQWIPKDIVPGQHVQQAFADIATAQSQLNATTWGSGNVLAGLTAVVPQVLLSLASFELSAWQGSNPGAQGFYAATAGIPIVHQLSVIPLVATMALPSLSQFSLNVANFLLPVVGVFGANVAPVQASVSSAQSNGQVYGIVPVSMYNTTEPVVNVSVNGGKSAPVLVDTGSSGLVISSPHVGTLDSANKVNTQPQTGAYSGGLTYQYDTYKNTTVDFGNGVVSDPTYVNVVTDAWYTDNPSDKNVKYFDEFLAGTGGVGILGIGANAYGPGPAIPTTSLPGELSDGVLIYQNLWPFGLGGVMVFGPNALPARATLTGTPTSTLKVSINGGQKQDVVSLIDSGGVYGTMPSNIYSNYVNYTDPQSGITSKYVPPNTKISVYTPDGQTLLYSYTTGDAPYAPSSIGPADDPSSDPPYNYLNTGYYAFQQGPVYIDYRNDGSYDNGGHGWTVFDIPWI